jgi:serine protease Do
VILEFDGYKVNEVRELPRIVADTPIGETVDVSVWRKGARVELRVTVARLNEDEMMAAPEGGDELLPVATDFLGMSLALLSDKLREKYELSQDSEGIVVVGISEESAAFEKGLREGDLIVEAAQKKMGSLEKFAKLVEKMKKEDRKSILLLVRRKDGNLRYLGLHLTE